MLRFRFKSDARFWTDVCIRCVCVCARVCACVCMCDVYLVIWPTTTTTITYNREKWESIAPKRWRRWENKCVEGWCLAVCVCLRVLRSHCHWNAGDRNGSRQYNTIQQCQFGEKEIPRDCYFAGNKKKNRINWAAAARTFAIISHILHASQRFCIASLVLRSNWRECSRCHTCMSNSLQNIRLGHRELNLGKR